ncbi:hypothetical protein SDC9_16488 [bioreactor metagenome]|jgi:O-antigen ligase|uniref:O-antigen ligase-related domain-containing protein n=1 Tax=bioreactor metagenome TaxID=1076179 RepID=A0A644TWC5_9ZZZZ
MFKKKHGKYLETLAYGTIAFFSVFLVSVSQVFIVNILFYPALLILSRKRRVFLDDSKTNNQVVVLVLFALSAILSSLVWYIEKYRSIAPSDTLRMLVQLLFTMQYAVLCLKIEIDWVKISRWFSRMVFFYAILIVLLFVATKSFRYMRTLLYIPEHRMWAEGLIPQWPNVSSLPLVFGCYLAFKGNRRTVEKVLIVVSTLLTTSRSGILGIGLIILYFTTLPVGEADQKKQIGTFLKRGFVLAAVTIIIASVIEPSVLPRLFLMSDRFDIASIGLGLLFERPLFGYGGLTLDQVIKTGSYSHLHNWFLEILFRYGSLGLMMFLLFLYSVWQRVKSRDDKFMMLVLLFLAFFQIYIRNFVFLMFLLYLENHETTPHVQEK